MNILTDPIWSERASPVSFAGPRRLVPPGMSFDDLPPIHATFVSHDHYDHLDDRTTRQLIQRFPSMHWLVPLGVGRFLSRRGASLVAELDWWDTLDLGMFSASCTPAQHFSGRYPWNRDDSLWCGWVIRFRGRSVFFAGDTAMHPEFRAIARRLGPFDAAILPISAYEPRWFMQPVHMNPTDATGAYCDLTDVSTRTTVMVPSHWGRFRLTDEPVAEPPAEALRAWSDAGLSTDMLWLFAHGETRSLA